MTSHSSGGPLERKRWCAMGDVICVVYGIVIFALLIGYVFGCEKV
jgi:hypothetical protein